MMEKITTYKGNTGNDLKMLRTLQPHTTIDIDQY